MPLVQVQVVNNDLSASWCICCACRRQSESGHKQHIPWSGGQTRRLLQRRRGLRWRRWQQVGGATIGGGLHQPPQVSSYCRVCLWVGSCHPFTAPARDCHRFSSQPTAVLHASDMGPGQPAGHAGSEGTGWAGGQAGSPSPTLQEAHRWQMVAMSSAASANSSMSLPGIIARQCQQPTAGGTPLLGLC